MRVEKNEATPCVAVQVWLPHLLPKDDSVFQYASDALGILRNVWDCVLGRTWGCVYKRLVRTYICYYSGDVDATLTTVSCVIIQRPVLGI